MLSLRLGMCLLTISHLLSPIVSAPLPENEDDDDIYFTPLEGAPPPPILQDQQEDSDILFYENVNDGKGNYKFSFETADNTRREETGQVMNAGQPDEYIEVNGSYSYVRPDGEEETVYYKADKDGFRTVPEPEQSHTSILAAIPSAVLASLAG